MALNNGFDLQLAENSSHEQACEALAAYCNELIKNNFERLVSLLYRIDVSEARLRQLLQQHPDKDAGLLIALLIMEREEQKIKTRRQFNQRANDIDEEEKW